MAMVDPTGDQFAIGILAIRDQCKAASISFFIGASLLELIFQSAASFNVFEQGAREIG